MADDTPEARLYVAFKNVTEVLLPLDQEIRQRAYAAVGAFFGYADAAAPDTPVPSAPQSPAPAPAPAAKPKPVKPRAAAPRAAAAAPAASSPKAFLAQKSPRTDVERVACFAYYLANQRSTPRFKTAEIIALNKEAGRAEFANAASAVNNAARAGFLTTASRGLKQLSAQGAKYVETLPDQAAAKDQMRKSKARRGRRKADASGAAGKD